MLKCIIVFNSGSSSIKFSLFSVAESELIFHGEAINLLTTPILSINNKEGNVYKHNISSTSHHAAIGAIIDWVESNTDGMKIIAAGHRIVHGGRDFSAPTVIDDKVLGKLKQLIPLAPLHQPFNLEAVKAITAHGFDIIQVACFDTAFHHNQPWLAKQFALPRRYGEEGIMRYGFHGLSYQYITSVLPQYIGDVACGKVIIAHLGNGASMCAIDNGRSIASTMGFTALEGLMMGTRCGSIDPGVILYMMQEQKLTPEEVAKILYKDSGLKGVSGISNDMQELLCSNELAAAEAVDLFCYQAAKQLSSLIPALGGLDALIFTAGIGENCGLIRQNICAQMSWMGVALDDVANKNNRITISTASSSIPVHVIHTDEEYIIFTSTRELLKLGSGSS